MALPARIADLLTAARTMPNRRGWARAALEAFWVVPLMLVIAHAGGPIRYDADLSISAGRAATLFIAPALGEELLFRGLIIPRNAPKGGWIALSALLFLLWHALQA